jgi:2-oxoisovalerate dehydrogenase E1 component
VDGCDPLATVEAYRAAAAHAACPPGPALVHAHVIRPYSHSLSDDETNYKTTEERERGGEARSRADLRETLVREGIVEREVLEAIDAQLDDEVASAADEAMAPPPEPRRRSTSSIRRRSIPPRRRSRASRARRAADDDGRPAQRLHEGRDAPRPRIVVFGEDVADASREERSPRSRARAASSR